MLTSLEEPVNEHLAVCIHDGPNKDRNSADEKGAQVEYNSLEAPMSCPPFKRLLISSMTATISETMDEEQQHIFLVHVRAYDGSNFTVSRRYSDFLGLLDEFDLEKNHLLLRAFPSSEKPSFELGCCSCSYLPDDGLEDDMNSWLQFAWEWANQHEDLHDPLYKFLDFHQNCHFSPKIHAMDLEWTQSSREQAMRKLPGSVAPPRKPSTLSGAMDWMHFLFGGQLPVNATPLVMRRKSPVQSRPPRPQALAEDDSTWMVEPFLEEFQELFCNGAKKGRDCLSQGQVRRILATSEYSEKYLDDKLWKLADVDKDGLLDFEEFAVAIYLIRLAADGITLPESLPCSIVPPSKRHLVELSPG